MRSILQKSNATLSAAALAVLLAVGSPAVAFAQRGDASTSGSGSTSTSGSTEVSTTSTTTTTSTAPETETSTEANSTSDNTTEGRHTKAQKMLDTRQAEHKPAKTDAEKAKACDEHKAGLETKFTSIARNSAAYQLRIDTIFAQAVAYQKDNNVTATNFTTLVDAAKVAQAKATVSVKALQTASTTPINCTDTKVATTVSEFKVTAANARRDLKAYKMSVKAVLKSLRDAKNDDTTTTAPTTTAETPKTKEKSTN